MPKITRPSNCPHCPDEITWEPDPSYDHPNCICNKPMMLYIPAGQHIHCPVHPGFRMFGQDIRCETYPESNFGCTYTHDLSKDLTFDSTRPFGTATGNDFHNTYKTTC